MLSYAFQSHNAILTIVLHIVTTLGRNMRTLSRQGSHVNVTEVSNVGKIILMININVVTESDTYEKTGLHRILRWS